ncbi:Vesicle-associated membrane protein [Forsythia ovata]|uniref:Vesicle-associated membrane protein n=1 Tax=Forsythia ovata TaxID=205694 RepID=A0ABD1WPN2_9LAMI
MEICASTVQLSAVELKLRGGQQWMTNNFELIDKRESRKGCKRKVELRDCPGNETMLPLEHSIFLTYPPELFHCKFTYPPELSSYRREVVSESTIINSDGMHGGEGGGAGDLCAVGVQRCEGNTPAIVRKILEKFSEVEHAESRLCFSQDRYIFHILRLDRLTFFCIGERYLRE